MRKIISLYAIAVITLVSTTCFATQEQACINEIRTIKADVRNGEVLDLALPKTCDAQGSCSYTRIQFSAKTKENLILLRSHCQEVDGRENCADWKVFSSFPTGSASGSSEDVLEHGVTIDNPDDLMSKITYVFRHPEIKIGVESNITIESNLEPIECYSMEAKVFKKTVANNVRDELNPYIGAHPDALIRTSVK